MSAGSEEPRLVLDTLGRRCPVPVIELARRIGDVAVGDVVAVLARRVADGGDLYGATFAAEQDGLRPISATS